MNGKIHAQEVRIDMDNWPDYVFDPLHLKPSLPELEAFIRVNRRLPEIPSASEVEKEGINVGAINKVLLKKIEELTLYLIEADKEISNQRKANEDYKRVLSSLIERIEKLETM